MAEAPDVQRRPLTLEIATMRAHFETLMEATQIKGDGETHPFLSPDDEFADYETWDRANLIGNELKTNDMLQYEYARAALKQGLKLEEELGVNPFKFGMVGSTNTHTGLTAAEEETSSASTPASSRGLIGGSTSSSRPPTPISPYTAGSRPRVGARRSGPQRTPVRPSSTPCGEKRSMRRRARACLFASSAVGTSKRPTLSLACRLAVATRKAFPWEATFGHHPREGPELPRGGHEGSHERQSGPHSDRQGLDGCER